MAERTRLDFTGPEIDDILEGIESHVSFAIEQETDATEKAQARSNIGAQKEVDAVETVEQERTDPERTRARINIGAVAPDAINEVAQTSRELDNTLNNKIDFTQAQELSAEQHRQVQENLGLNIKEKTSKMILPVGRDGNGKLWTYDVSKPLNPDTWEDVGKILERGLASEYWEPGDQLKVKKTIGSTTETLIFDILGFDYDTPIDANVKHTMSLAMHSIYSYNEIPFDPREAFYYCADGLTAGTYYFNMGVQPWFAGDVGKNMQFTLTKNVPAGGQLVMNQSYNATLIGSTISSFSSGMDRVELEKVTVSEGNTGTNLGTIAHTVSGNFNSFDRTVLGSNNWQQSSDRRYLNSNAAGAPSNTIASWYGAPATNWDRPVISTKPGFLYGIEQGFLNLLVNVKKRTALNTVTDGGGYIDLDEKVFFMSMTECNLGKNNNVNETSFGIDRTFTNALTTPYPLYIGADNADRIKYQGSTAGNWLLRSPDSFFAHSVRRITADGGLSNTYPYLSNNIVPALCIGR